MKLDILVFAAHPDDAELGCSGTILSHIAKGYKVGIIDLTMGELGTRGSGPLRLEEAEEAARIMGVYVRRNLYFRDGFFEADENHILRVIKEIRTFQPEIVFANAVEDRHPDHGRAGELLAKACFLSGLIKIETQDNGVQQEAWRPKFVYHYIQDRYIKPDFVVNITPFWDKKIEAMMAFKSQFYNPDNTSPDTYISSPEFLNFIRSRAEEMGHSIGVQYGEGFTSSRRIGVEDVFTLK